MGRSCGSAELEAPGGAQALAGGRSRVQAPTTGPDLQLIAAQHSITLQESGTMVFLDPGIYVASLGSALRLDVQRASYTRPVTITQVISPPGGGTTTRRLPAAVLSGFSGLRQFLLMQVVNASGQTVFAQRMLFCPNTFDPQRATPDGPPASPYPELCDSSLPFPLAEVWAIAKGWALDPVEGTGPKGAGPALTLPPGTYKVTESITGAYRRIFNIGARRHGDRSAGATPTSRRWPGSRSTSPTSRTAPTTSR